MIGSYTTKLLVVLSVVLPLNQFKFEYLLDFLPCHYIKDYLGKPITSAFLNRLSLLDMESINCISGMTCVLCD